LQEPKAWSRAVVTGADGFIGSHLVRQLQRAGKEVVAFGGYRTGTPGRDLCEPGMLDRHLDDRTFVFHLAGTSDVRRSVDTPIDDFRANVVASLNVLESVRKVAASMLFTSTASVYDRNSPLPLSESAMVRPSSPYAAAKAAIEAYCSSYVRSFALEIRVARLFSVYGPGMRRFAIYDFYRRINQNPTGLSIRGDGGQTRDYLFVDDAARILLGLASFGQTGEIYNVASGVPRQINDVARAVAIAMGLPDCRILPDRVHSAAELDRMEADVAKLRKLGLLEDLISFEEGLDRTIAWLEKQESDVLTS
jgi:UDP-glucose 4-epimerase